jgi:anti-sigma B factor antagonist
VDDALEADYPVGVDNTVDVTVRRADQGSDAVVVVTGEIDLCTAPDMRQGIMDALADEPQRIRVDLTGVSLLDSTGVFVLVDTYKRARERGVVLIVENPQELVHRVLSICGLLEILTAGEPQIS